MREIVGYIPFERFSNSLRSLKRTSQPPFRPIDSRGKDTEIPDPARAPYFIEGQGTYTEGLAGDLVDRFPKYFDIASEVVNRDVRNIALKADREQLTKTGIAQIVTSAYALACMDMLRESEPGALAPEIAGKSLGFNVGAFEAGCFGPREDIDSLRKFYKFIEHRGYYMERDCEEVKTGLANISVENPVAWGHIDYMMRQYGIEPAFYVTETQRRVGGKLEELSNFVQEVKARGYRGGIMKDVGGAYHTPYFSWSRGKIAELVDDLGLQSPDRPLVPNIKPDKPITTAEEVAREMIGIITEPVDEMGMLRLLQKEGYDSFYRIGQPKPFETDGTKLTPVLAKAAVVGGVLATTGIIAWKVTRSKN